MKLKPNGLLSFVKRFGEVECIIEIISNCLYLYQFIFAKRFPITRQCAPYVHAQHNTQISRNKQPNPLLKPTTPFVSYILHKSHLNDPISLHPQIRHLRSRVISQPQERMQ